MKATDRIPPARQRAKPKESELWLVAMEAQGHWLLRNPAEKGLLAGLWTWPTVAAIAPSPTAIAAESGLPYTAADVRSWAPWTQVYSHRRELIRVNRNQVAAVGRNPNVLGHGKVEENAGAAAGRRRQPGDA